MDVVQGRVVTVEPYPVFVPLFRQVPVLQEVTFGVFVPVWPPEEVGEVTSLPVLPPLEAVPAPESAPDWPLVPEMPKEMVGERTTPILGRWLRERRKAGRAVGRVVEVARRGVPPLKADRRKWPEVAVERVRAVEEVGEGKVSFLWTPFALQRSEEREEWVERARRVVEQGGVWAFVDVLPTSMAGHWLYRFFPEVWENEETRTWDGARMYNLLKEAGFEVRLARRSFYQPVRLGVALEMAREREASPQLRVLPEEVYAAGLARLEEVVKEKGEETLTGSEFCLVEVLAERK
ncbi:MAG TPA: hypothetical protein G4O00_13035 [Thermoflexia bacterium]|nr:hypothetical protein [Thermoflexia bacterium]